MTLDTMASQFYNSGMSKERLSFGDQFRQAVNMSGMSRYAVCKACKIDQGAFSRFMSGQVGMTLANLEAVAALLDLRVVPGKTVRKKGGK